MEVLGALAPLGLQLIWSERGGELGTTGPRFKYLKTQIKNESFQLHPTIIFMQLRNIWEILKAHSQVARENSKCNHQFTEYPLKNSIFIIIH